MDFLDYYAILGISPSAGESALHEAYRMAARTFHPDVNKSPGAAVLFRDINRAYETLSDPQKRADYDILWREHSTQVPGLQVETLLSRRQIRPLDEPQVLYVLLKLQPVSEQVCLATSAPLNLSLVVDRSTSMKGTRLQNVKQAVHRIIDECSPDDIISIITFSDNAEVLVPAQHLDDARSAKALVSAIRADGATAIYSGLKAGLAQIERNRHTRYVNHLILITDGRTYGDEDECLNLAKEAHARGVGISGMGIGEDWNDRFLDGLASRTGGSSAYISSPDAVNRFLHERIRSLATAYAERAQLIIAPTPGVHLESVVRLAPHPMTLDAELQPIPLGAIDGVEISKLMLQFHVLTDGKVPGKFTFGRADLMGEVLGGARRLERAVVNLALEISNSPAEEDPPPELLDALSRLALYRLQDRAREALEQGDVAEATRKLEYLATRLFESGAEELGQAALYEARRVAQTNQLSDVGTKHLKYGTRGLLPLWEKQHD